MAHTDACKIQVCQLLERLTSKGLGLNKAAKEVMVESDGIPASTIKRWWYEVKGEVESDRTPKELSGSKMNRTKSTTYKDPNPKQDNEEQEDSKPELYKPASFPIPVFNETNENIDWARWSWNPVTGCLHGCKYCYARDIANRFFKQKFKPSFHPNRLSAPQNTALPDNLNGRDRNVFVCSMADLFGNWVKDEWISRTMDAVRNAPEWNFIFLTKNPERMVDIEWPNNTKIGATVDVQSRVHITEQSFKRIKAPVKFISCEPLLEELEFNDLSIFDCIIIGGQSKTTQCPEFQPKREWVTNLLVQADVAKVKRIFLKPNLTVYRQYP